MRGKYEIVNPSTTREDVSFTFQRYNGYTGLHKRHQLLMCFINMMLFWNAEGDKQPRRLKVIQNFYIF